MANHEDGQTLAPGDSIDPSLELKSDGPQKSKTHPKDSHHSGAAATSKPLVAESQDLIDKGVAKKSLPPVEATKSHSAKEDTKVGTRLGGETFYSPEPASESVSGSDSFGSLGDLGATLAPGSVLDSSQSGISSEFKSHLGSTGPKSKIEPEKTINISGDGASASAFPSEATLAPGSIFDSVSSDRGAKTIPAGKSGPLVSKVAESDSTLAPGNQTHFPESEATLAPGSQTHYPESEATLAPGTLSGDVSSDATLAPGSLSPSQFSSSDATMAPGSQWGSVISDQTMASGNLSRAPDDGATMAHGSQTGSKTEAMGQGSKKPGPTIRYPVSKGDKTEPLSPAVDAKGNKLPVISGYELLGELGRGGMGVVYRARQKGLGRMVALKMVLNNQASQEELDRFMLEAQAVALVEHPNIVQIYDVGEFNNLPYFSLEFVDGGPLDKKLNSEPQDPTFTAQVMAKVCRAMGFAHSKQILHRDLKPANVLLTKGGEPKITDFGLAKQMDAPDEGHTKAGSIMGTPSYMPPEQAEGKAKDLTNRADIYSLGAILYEFITGRPPFKGRTLLETLQHVRTKEPVPPIQLQPSVPPDLQTICLKSLEKDPAKRYNTAEEMADDLEAVLRGDPIKARPISQFEKSVRWAKRNKPQAALIAMGVAMVCLVILSGFVYLGMDAHNQRLRAERVEKINQERKDAEALLAESVRQGDQNQWNESKGTALQAKAKLGEDEEFDEVRQKVESQIAKADSHIETDSQRAQFDSLIDAAYFSATDLTGKNPAENTRDIIENVTKALELFGVVIGSKDFEPKFGEHFDPAQRARISKDCAYLLLLLATRKLDQDFSENKPIDSIANLIEAAKKGGVGEKSYRLVNGRFLGAKGARGDEPSKELALKEMKIQEKLTPKDPQEWFLVGEFLYNIGDYASASEAFSELSRLNPRDFWSVYYRALCAIRRDSWAEAAALLQNSISLNESFPYTYTLMGIAEGKMGHFDKAETFFAKSKSLLKGESAGFLINRAALRFDQGKFNEAETDLRQAIKIDSNNWEALDNLGMVLRKKGKLNEALSSFSQAERNSKKQLDPLRHLASLLTEFDPPRWQESMEVYNKILKLEKDEKKLASAYAGLATAHLALKEYPEAKALLEKSTKLDPDSPTTWFVYANVINELAAAQDLILNQVGTVQTKVDRKSVENLYREAIKAYDKGIELTAQGKSNETRSQSLSEFYRKQNPEGKPETLEARIMRTRGFIKARLGDYGGAMVDYTRSLDLNGDQASLRIRRGTALISKWRDLALLDYNEAIKLNPNDLEAFAGRAYVNAIMGKHTAVVNDVDLIYQEKANALGAQINAACALAQAYKFAKDPLLGANPAPKETQDLYLQKLWKMIEKAMAGVPEPQWKRMWNQAFRGDDSFDPVRNLPEWKAFDKKFGG